MESRHKSVPPLVPPKSPTLMRTKHSHLSQQNLHHQARNKKRSDKTTNPSANNTVNMKANLIWEQKRSSVDNMEIVEQPQLPVETSESMKRSYEKLNETSSFHKTFFSSLRRKSSSQISEESAAIAPNQIKPSSKSVSADYFNNQNNNNSSSSQHSISGTNNDVSSSSSSSTFSHSHSQQQQSPLHKPSIKQLHQQSPLVISSRGSLPLHLSRLTLGSCGKQTSVDSNDGEGSGPAPTSESSDTGASQSQGQSLTGNKPTDVKILVNDVEVKLRRQDGTENGLPNPRRPMKRKSQDYDRNFLSESGSISSSTRNSDFWLPKVKVTPSMVTQLNADILAQFQQTNNTFKGNSGNSSNNSNINSSSNNQKEEQGERDRMTHVIQFLGEFLNANGFLQPNEKIRDAVETMSTRILTPTDDEYWTVLTTLQVINVSFCSKRSATTKVLGTFPLIQITRILTDADLSLAYVVGPEIEIVTGDSNKTEKLISSILVAALRAQKSSHSLNLNTNLTKAVGTNTQQKSQDEKLQSEHNQQQQQQVQHPSPTRMVGTSTSASHSMTSVAQFLEVRHVSSTLEIPSIRDAFKRLFPHEKQVFYSSAVVVRFDQMAGDIEIPVRIQVAAEGNDFRASILKLSGCTLTFCNPVRTFFSFNPGDDLSNIDVANSSAFTVKRTESPKPHSLLIIHMDKFLLVETPGAQQAEEIFQRIHTIQQNATIGNGKQVAHIFITEQSLLALKIHTYENIFQIPILNLVKLHKPLNQQTTCILELESTEAMEHFIPSESPCWSLTFNSNIQKNKFINRVSHFLQQEEKSV